MKPKYITPDNYQQFKPSELVHSFISDIEVAERIGKPMDMSNYFSSKNCLPCLGGMALLNWGNISTNKDVGFNVSHLGDAIRRGVDIQYWLQEMYPNVGFYTINPNGTKVFGMIQLKSHIQFTALKRQVMLYVKELEKHGL